jgi:hypothetical protein
MTTTGDLIYSSDNSGTPARLGGSNSGFVLTAAGAAAPSWAQAIAAQSAKVATSQTTSSSSYTDLATAGPAVTVVVPASGNVLVGIGAEMTNGTSGLSLMSVALSGANTVSAPASNYILIYGAPITSGGGEMGKMSVLTGLTPGSTTFTAKYKSTAGTGTFINREVIVIPLP